MLHDTDDWFSRRTFHHRRFEPAEALLDAKQRAGTTISVCLPALNEAATIGEIVRVLRETLVERIPLIDELVVMDAASTDATARIAAAAGATVVQERDVLPEMGPGAGKGEGLWKSLDACTGELLCWIDTDIANIHPRFVTGLVGPLLADPSIAYVKGFYERPLADGAELRPTGGGRVTELLARPLINAFWPALSGLVQPLSGEFAGRRELLERVPFFSGYGVELGLLLDVVHAAGVDAIAQVDLDRRVHRNQDLPSLSRMSFGVLQAALAHLADEGRLSPGSWTTGYTQFARGLDGYEASDREVSVTRRPPMASVASYARRRAAPLAGRG
jgi:glucosyl-3-phosphoglycerate synthase